MRALRSIVLLITMLLFAACTTEAMEDVAPQAATTEEAPSDTLPEDPTATGVELSSTPQQALPAPTESLSPTPPQAEADPAPAELLPAPVYFISGEDSQIYQLAADGIQLNQITFEPNAVDEFAVSVEAGLIAYASGNSIYLVDLFGAGRQAIAEGAPEASDFFNRLTNLTWSPDGSTLAFFDRDVIFYDVATGATEIFLESDPPPDFNADPPDTGQEPAISYSPISFSPDGTLLLVQEGIYYSDGITQSVYAVDSGARTQLTQPAGLVCCNPTWTPDASAIYTSSDSVGFINPGLWRIEAATGEGTTIVDGTPQGEAEIYRLVFGARLLEDGQLYRFEAEVEGFPQQQQPLTMARSGPFGEGFETLRTEAYIPGDVLWSPNGEGAVLLDLTAQYSEQGFPDFPYRGDLLWLPADGSTAVNLNVIGGQAQWGE